jgi:hypothetical protein
VRGRPRAPADRTPPSHPATHFSYALLVPTALDSSLAAGRAALVGAAWAEARSQFEAALAVEESVEALEGLGVAARWQMDGSPRSRRTSARTVSRARRATTRHRPALRSS